MAEVTSRSEPPRQGPEPSAAASEVAGHRLAAPGECKTSATISWDPSEAIICCEGCWTLEGITDLNRGFRRLSLPESGHWKLDAAGIERLDTAGAVMLCRVITALRNRGVEVEVASATKANAELFRLANSGDWESQLHVPERPGGLLRDIGAATVGRFQLVTGFLEFVGETAADTLPRLLKPHRLRWRQVLGEIQTAGVNALPILGLLSMLVGLVIAYQGGIPLRSYGANIFIVDLVAVTTLREMAPLLTAVIVAGRTGSAYAAQLGTMKITEEVDALRTLGITPFEMLVVPKVLGLLIVMPLLTVFADLMGMAGGMLAAQSVLSVSWDTFLERVPQVIAPSSFWVGIGKAPVFAALIASVGCYQGLRVQGGTEAVGRATTTAVVQGIFLVILADAMFSVGFDWLGL